MWHEILINCRLKSFVRSLKTVYLYFIKTLARNLGEWPRNTKFTDSARNFNQLPAEILRQKPHDSIPVFYQALARKFGKWRGKIVAVSQTSKWTVRIPGNRTLSRKGTISTHMHCTSGGTISTRASRVVRPRGWSGRAAPERRAILLYNPTITPVNFELSAIRRHLRVVSTP
jgi:hypothetical protein